MSLGLRVRAAWNSLTGSTPTAFDAAGRGGSRTVAWNPPPANFGMLRPPPALLWRARDVYRNNPWGKRAIEATVSGAVSTGIKPMLTSNNLPLKRRAQDVFLDWTDQCDFEGLRDFYGFQADLLRNVLIDGESLVLMTPDGPGAVPLQLRLLGPEYLDRSRVIVGKVLDGIEYDATGRRVAYWIYPQHPASFPTYQSVRVPAENVIHVFQPPAPGVPRGVSWLAPALTALHELQGFMEAELVRSRTASLFAGFVRTQDGSNPLANKDGQLMLEPGSVSRLGPGEEISFSVPPESRYFAPYVQTQLRGIASALNMPYEVFADVSMVTFASGREGLLLWKRYLEMLVNHVMVFQFCRPVWDLWIRYALVTGVLDGSIQDYRGVRWVAPPLEMLDARAEVLGLQMRVRNGFMSRSEAVNATGLDAEQVEAEIAAENRRADALGLVLDSDPRQTTAQGQEQPSAVEDPPPPISTGGNDDAVIN
ncbi:MAG: phage portal protein [Bryobacteraceae bacterium]